MRRASGWLGRCLVALVLGVSAAPAIAQADQLTAETAEREAGYAPVEELSYEAIVEASQGFRATLRLRVALRNHSLSPRDFVHTVALPFAARVEGLAVARDGLWSAGQPTRVLEGTDRRDPHSIFVRQLDPSDPSDIPAAEIVGFGLAPGATVQIEVVTRIYPRLSGDRWQVELPARGVDLPALAGERRVLVKGLPPGRAFFVDEETSGSGDAIVTRPRDMVTVSWPATVTATSILDARYEAAPAADGDGGDLRVYLRLGLAAPLRPDHVIALVDRSASTPTRMREHATTLLERLFAALPPEATFDALAFDRFVTPLLDREQPVRASPAHAELRRRLAAREAGQGTDLAAALAAAAERAAARPDRRTLIVVITDGMFPVGVGPSEITTAFERARGKARPDLLFVVDEPMLAHKGLDVGHPVARLAATLGARISLETLSQLDGSEALLASPPVLGELALQLGARTELVDPLPQGLVAGSFVVLRGRYEGRRPRAATLAGRLEGRTLRRRLRAELMPPLAEAFAAVTEGELALAVTEGFVRPPWYRARDERDARRVITQAGRAGRPRAGHLSRGIVQRHLVTRVLPRARACYNRALHRQRTQAGRVVLEMEVAKGEVMFADATEVELAHPDPGLTGCLREAAWSLAIPAGELDDRVYRIRYPLQLVPPKDERDPGSVERLPEEVMDFLLSVPLPDP